MRHASIPNRRIPQTIAEGEQLGLVAVTHRGSYAGGSRNNPSTFRLTYLPFKLERVGQPTGYFLPTDEWRQVASKIRPNALTGGAINHAQGEHSTGPDAP